MMSQDNSSSKAAPPPPPPLSSSVSAYSNMAELIRSKERELQQIQDLRNLQLETMLEERDRLLVESSRRFEQLKEDFQYNLQLIEARDVEIERLESQLTAKDDEMHQAEENIKALSMKLDHLHQKEVERLQKADQERQQNKKIFDELKAVIESVQFSAEEENKLKQMEIDKLKKDIDTLYQSKEHALELQRKDLTGTFEQILQERELQFQHKELDIQKQIQMIDDRFEKLQTENIYMKEQFREYKLKYEKAVEDVNQKDEKIRQLQYQVEDERNLKLSLEDSMTRQLHDQKTELQRLIDLRMRERLDHENALEQVTPPLLLQQLLVI